MSGQPTVYAVILAGGASARFWPSDGDDAPKFMLRPVAAADGSPGKTLLAGAWERCLALTTPERIVVVTGFKQAKQVREQLPYLPTGNVLIEPARRDTLAAATLATTAIEARSPGAVMVLTPADNLVDPAHALAHALSSATQSGMLAGGRLFSFGVTPTRAETGFGWLEAGDPLGRGVVAAVSFVEKPDAATAERFLKDKRHFWNSGSFAWLAADFLNEVRRQQPAVAAAVAEYARLAPRAPAAAATAWEAMSPISVDHGVMEGARSVAILPLDAEFDDIGNWDVMAARGCLRHPKPPAPQPLADGQPAPAPEPEKPSVILVDSHNCDARTQGSVAFVGVSDLIVVQEGDRVLVMKRGAGQQVRKIRELETPPRREKERGSPPAKPPAKSTKTASDSAPKAKPAAAKKK